METRIIIINSYARKHDVILGLASGEGVIIISYYENIDPYVLRLDKLFVKHSRVYGRPAAQQQ